MKKLLICALAIALVSCGTLYTNIVTVTTVRKDIINQLGVQYRAGLIDHKTDLQITAADNNFKEAARLMELALTMKKMGQPGEPAIKLSDVKAPLLEMIIILNNFTSTTLLKKNLDSATKL